MIHSLSIYWQSSISSLCFFLNDPATTELYTLSLHDALPISGELPPAPLDPARNDRPAGNPGGPVVDRKSTRLNSSHPVTSYAVFCLKKKKATKRSSQMRPNFCASCNGTRARARG